MICRFCQQWNPDGADRCCFCQNQANANEDVTAAPRRGAAAPRASASFSTLPSSKTQLDAIPLWAIGAGMVTAIGLLLLLRNC